VSVGGVVNMTVASVRVVEFGTILLIAASRTLVHWCRGMNAVRPFTCPAAAATAAAVAAEAATSGVE